MRKEDGKRIKNHIKTEKDFPRLQHSFTQMRADFRMCEFWTYPNSIIVFVKDTGEMALMSTDPPAKDPENENIETHNCWTMHKESKDLKEFLMYCESHAKHGNVYLIEVWENKTKSDMALNDHFITHFIDKPVTMFEKEEA